MKFLKTSIEEINKYFEPLPKDSFFYKELTESEKTINKAIKYYKVEYFNDEEFEKIPIEFSEYDSQNKTHFSKWNLNYLKDNLILSDLKKELVQNTENNKNKFIKKLDERLLNLFTDLQIKNELDKLVEQINNSIDSLNRLKANKYQKITINILIESYKETLAYLNTKYEKYLDEPIENDLLEKFIIHSKLHNLLTIESKLIEFEMLEKINGKLYWSKKKGFKIKLINFCRLLHHKKYINKYISIERVIDFFEERYNIDTGDQAKPSKFKNSIKLIEADFLFLNL